MPATALHHGNIEKERRSQRTSKGLFSSLFAVPHAPPQVVFSFFSLLTSFAILRGVFFILFSPHQSSFSVFSHATVSIFDLVDISSGRLSRLVVLLFLSIYPPSPPTVLTNLHHRQPPSSAILALLFCAHSPPSGHPFSRLDTLTTPACQHLSHLTHLPLCTPSTVSRSLHVAQTIHSSSRYPETPETHRTRSGDNDQQQAVPSQTSQSLQDGRSDPSRSVFFPGADWPLYDDGCLAFDTIGVSFRSPPFFSSRPATLFDGIPSISYCFSHQRQSVVTTTSNPKSDRDGTMEIDSPVEDGAQAQQAPSSPSMQDFTATGAAGQQAAQTAQEQAANQAAANHLSFRR